MAARPRRTVRCKALQLACWNGDGVRGRKLELEHFLNQNGVDIYLLSETFLKPDQAYRIPNYVCHRTHKTIAGGRYSHPSPPWYSHPLGARSGPDQLGGHSCSSHIGLQTDENPCGLPLTLPPIDRSGHDRLFRWGIAGPDGRRSQRQTRGLELAADHETGENPT